MFDRDGLWLYSAGQDGLVRCWKPTSDPDADEVLGDRAYFASRAGVAHDGRSFFTYSLSKQMPWKWELIHRDMASLRELAGIRSTGRAVVSEDGKRVAFQKPDERRIRIWDVFADRQLAELESPAWTVERKGFSPDGRLFVLTEPDRINVYECETGKPLKTLPLAKANALAFSPDGGGFVAKPRPVAQPVWLIRSCG